MKTSVAVVRALIPLLLLSAPAGAQPLDRYRLRDAVEPPEAARTDELPILEPGGPRAARDPGVRPYCSEVEPGRAFLEFSWRQPEGVEALQRLEITPFRDGFEVGRLQTFWLKPDRPEIERQTGYPGETPQEPESPRIALEIEAVVPGGNDYWRVLTLTEDGWVPSETMRVEIPVCPVDSRPSETVIH